MITLLLCAAVFHVLILTRIIPFTIVWGGRLETVSQMYAFESLSLTINIAMIAVIGMKGRYIKPVLHETIINGVLWLLVVLFSLNTVGNIFSLSTLEAILFTPVTLISAVLCFRIAIEKPEFNKTISSEEGISGPKTV